MFAARLRKKAASFLEPGETIHRTARVVTGAQNHALVATDRHIYVLRLRWPGLANPVEQLNKVPLGQARLALDGERITLHSDEVTESWRRGRNSGTSQVNLPGHDELVEYVNGTSAAA